MLIMVLLPAGTQAAPPARSAQDLPALEGLSEIPMGNLHALALDGDRAFVGLGPRLVILDSEAADGPRPLGFGPVLGDDVLDIAVRQGESGHVMVAAGEAGLIEFDVSDPSRPVEIRRMPGYASALRIEGERVYVLGEALRILEFAGPDALQELGRIDLPIETFDLAGDVIWLAAGPAGVMAYDISDPARPAPVGALDTPGSAHDVRVEGGLAYVADGGRRLSILDLADPLAPRLLTSLEIDLSGDRECAQPEGDCGLDARRVQVHGDRVLLTLQRYLGAFSSRVQARMVLIDVADPVAAREIGQRTFRGNPHAVAMDAQGIMAAELPLWWYAGTAPCQLAAGGLGRYSADLEPAGRWEPPALANAVELNEKSVWLADPIQWLRVYALDDPTEPKPVIRGYRSIYGSRYGSAEVRDLVVNEGGARLVLGSQTGGFLAVQSVHLPTSPNNGCAPPSQGEWYRRIATDGERDYLLDLAGSLQVFELGAFRAAGSLALDQAQDLAARDGRVLIAGDTGLTILDAGDPAAPRQLARLALAGFGQAAAYAPSVELAALAGERGLALVDLRQPASPGLIAQVSTQSPARALALSGPYAYVLSESHLSVFDLGVAGSPMEVSRTGADGHLRGARGLAVGDGLVALLAAGGLSIYRALPEEGRSPGLPAEIENGGIIYLPQLILKQDLD